eukprot:4798806-Heterocapsa_arctica.AAC.1
MVRGSMVQWRHAGEEKSASSGGQRMERLRAGMPWVSLILLPPSGPQGPADPPTGPGAQSSSGM